MIFHINGIFFHFMQPFIQKGHCTDHHVKMVSMVSLRGAAERIGSRG